jgi:hypothetical protein
MRAPKEGEMIIILMCTPGGGFSQLERLLTGQRLRVQPPAWKVIPIEEPRPSTIGKADLIVAAVRDGFMLHHADIGHAPMTASRPSACNIASLGARNAGGLLRLAGALQPDKVLAEIISPSTRPTATANIVGMTNSMAISFRVIAQTRFDLPLWSSNHLRVSRAIEAGLLRVVGGREPAHRRSEITRGRAYDAAANVLPHESA